MHKEGEYSPDKTIVLHPYGRYSNAFKFAGEVDVLEALEDVCRRYPVDRNRISARGFSMGGAAAWQFATHYSDRWFAANPGAGFSETPQFLVSFQQEQVTPTPWQRKLWNLYNCDKYALNLLQCPTIAYSGELDRQKQAADVMSEALAQHNIRLRHVIGAQMGHKIDDLSKQTIEAALAELAAIGRNSMPWDVQLVTYTLKYNRMHWLTITGLKEHWERATIHARWSHDTTHQTLSLQIDSTNVTGLAIRIPAGMFRESLQVPKITITVNNRTLETPGPTSDGAWTCDLRSVGPAWQLADTVPDELVKKHDLQGPIDDAFMDAFVFVRPTGQAAHTKVGKWADEELTRAIEHWRRHFRGDAKVIDDTEVTDEWLQSHHLILWGDPSSNHVLGKIVKQLPLVWSSDTIRVGTTSYAADHHAPVMIFPNPLNRSRYVVLNSSFTFREYAYLNNARQVPMLPDWAIVDVNTPAGTVNPGRIVAADFFNEAWQLK
jgi:hypothetical protein